MTQKRADFVAALECRRPEVAVPFWEIEFHAWDALSRRHVILGQEFEDLSPAQQERALESNAEIFLAVSEQLGYSAMTVPGNYWHQAPGQLAYFVLPGEWRYRQIEVLRKVVGDRLTLIANTGGVLAANYSEDFCDKLYNEPDAIDVQARNILQWGVDAARRVRDLGVDVAMSASDIADNSGPFFNPEQMKRFVLPYLNEWSVKCHEMGLHTILHSDGQLTPYLDAIAATEVDALQAIDPIAGMDMRQAREIVGKRLCLCGNVDCGLLLRGRPEDVYQATSDLLKTCKAEGGLILGASNAVQSEVPAANYLAVVAAHRDHGGYV